MFWPQNNATTVRIASQKPLDVTRDIGGGYGTVNGQRGVRIVCSICIRRGDERGDRACRRRRGRCRDRFAVEHESLGNVGRQEDVGLLGLLVGIISAARGKIEREGVGGRTVVVMTVCVSASGSPTSSTSATVPKAVSRSPMSPRVRPSSCKRNAVMYSALLCGNHSLRIRPRSTRKMDSGRVLLASTGRAAEQEPCGKRMPRLTLATILRDILEQADSDALVLQPPGGLLGADLHLHQRHGAGAAIAAAERLREPPQTCQTRRRSA